MRLGKASRWGRLSTSCQSTASDSRTSPATSGWCGRHLCRSAWRCGCCGDNWEPPCWLEWPSWCCWFHWMGSCQWSLVSSRCSRWSWRMPASSRWMKSSAAWRFGKHFWFGFSYGRLSEFFLIFFLQYWHWELYFETAQKCVFGTSETVFWNCWKVYFESAENFSLKNFKLWFRFSENCRLGFAENCALKPLQNMFDATKSFILAVLKIPLKSAGNCCRICFCILL